MYYGENPVHGTISFDSIGWAWVTLFQCVTMEGWVDIMYMVQDGYSDIFGAVPQGGRGGSGGELPRNECTNALA